MTFDDDSRSGRDAEVSRATAEVTRLFRDCEARLSAVGRNGGDHSGRICRRPTRGSGKT